MLGLRQSEVAKMVNMSQKDVSLVERGKREFIPNRYFRFLLDSKIDLNSLFDPQMKIQFITVPSDHVPQENVDQMVNNIGYSLLNLVNNKLSPLEKEHGKLNEQIEYLYKVVQDQDVQMQRILDLKSAEKAEEQEKKIRLPQQNV